MTGPKTVRRWFWGALGVEEANVFMAGWFLSHGRWGLAVVNVVGAVACRFAATSLFRSLRASQ
jgi:hypothetical protein